MHAYLREAAAEGVAVLLISEDLDEILALADRVAVMYEGRVVGELAAAGADVEEIGLLMAGGHDPRCGSSGGSTSRAGCSSPCRSARSLFAFVLSRDRPPGDRPRRGLVASGRSSGPRSPPAARSAQTLIAATPLAFTGLAAAAAFRMKLFNIGGEGQLYIGAITAAAAGLYLGGLGWPRPVVIAAMVVAGAAGGAAWASIPGVLRAFFRTSEIITSLMLNYVAAYLLTYLIFNTRVVLPRDGGLQRDGLPDRQGAARQRDAGRAGRSTSRAG